MSDDDRERQDLARALALAGVLQAVALADETARSAEPDPATLTAVLAPLFRFDAVDVPAVYAGIGNLTVGLEILHRNLSGTRVASDEVLLRYALNLLQFERSYSNDVAMQGELKRRLLRHQLQGDPLGVGGPAMVEALAETWTRTLGKLRPRILVSGDPKRLRDKRVVNLVRALLLAGLRSAVLWRQVGGSRWSLLLSRAALLRAVERARAG